MKKRGFTLIELLATVAVLAIVALIAIPLISGITERIEKKSFKQSAIGLLKTTGLERNNGISVYEKYIIGNSSIKINKNGQIVTVNNDGKITGNGYAVYLETGESFINYTNGKWCATKDFDEQEVRVIKGDCTDIDLFTCSKPEISKNVGNEIWTQYKIVTVGNNRNRNCKIKYSIDNGEYKEYKEPLTITKDQTNIKVKAINVENEGVEEEEAIENIDTTAPINVEAKRGAVTSNSITVVADGRDNESGIYGYLFSKDGGTTWVSGNEDNSPQTNNAYIFTGLTHNTEYNIKVKVYNHTYGSEGWEEEKGATESEINKIKTTKIEEPTYNVPNGWTNTSKTVTINYPTGEGYIYEYSKDGGEWTPYPSTGVTFTSNGTIAARVRDGAVNDPKTNIVSKIAVTISGIDKTTPTIVLGSNSDTNPSKTKSVTVTLQDTGESGIKAATSGIKYAWSTSNTVAPTSWYTTNVVETTGTNTTTFAATGSEVTGEYYLWVQPVDYQDKAGNKNTTAVVSTGTFKYDNTTPTVTYTFTDGTTATHNKAYNTNKTLKVTARDTGGSGLNYMNVHLYSGVAGDYSHPIAYNNGIKNSEFNVTLTEGTWTIYTQVYDAAGNKQCQQPDNAGNNCSGWYYQTYVIDTTAPTVTYAFTDGTTATNNGTYNTNKTVRVTASDTNFSYMNVHLYSGVAGDYTHPVSLPYGINSQTYDVTLTEGTWTIYTQVFDKAGNKECQQPDDGGSNCSGFYYQTYTISYPAYYAFGMPDTSSTTDYTTLNKNVFIRLKGGEYSVCVYYPGEIFECHPASEYSNDSSLFGKVTKKTSDNIGIECGFRGYIDSRKTGCQYDNRAYCGIEVNPRSDKPKMYCYDDKAYCLGGCESFNTTSCNNFGCAQSVWAAHDKCVASCPKVTCPSTNTNGSNTSAYCYNQCNSTSTRANTCRTVGDNRESCSNNLDICLSSCYGYYTSNGCTFLFESNDP